MGTVRRLARSVRPAVERHLPSLAATYRSFREHRQVLREPVDTPMGFTFAGNAAMEQGDFEPAETALVERALARVDTVVNVGANAGYYCCVALKRGKRVVAFEPVHGNLRLLLRNVTANGWERRIEVFPIALSDSVGVARMYGAGVAASLVEGWADIPEAYVELVHTSTYDTVMGSRLAGRRCLFIVDVEGWERRVLAGMSTALRSEPRPLWMVEIATVHARRHGAVVNPDLLATFRTFWEEDYESFAADESMRPVLPDEVHAAAGGGSDGLGTRNFLFIHRSTDAEHSLLDRPPSPAV